MTTAHCSSPNNHLHLRLTASKPLGAECTVIFAGHIQTMPELCVMSNSLFSLAAPITTMMTTTTTKLDSAPADCPYKSVATKVIAPKPSYG